MRIKTASSTVLPFPARASSFARRAILPAYSGLTALVLIVHAQTERALQVSDTGDRTMAVWIPKAMVTIDEFSEHGLVVASMSALFANQKRLHPRSIDTTLFTAATAEVLREAQARAARKRNFYRGYRAPTARACDRNTFA